MAQTLQIEWEFTYGLFTLVVALASTLVLNTLVGTVLGMTKAVVLQIMAVTVWLTSVVICQHENSGVDGGERKDEAQEEVVGVHVDVFVDSQGASVLGGFKSLEGKDRYDC